jgi:uncharacterized protein YyaL (SSP411 family)
MKILGAVAMLCGMWSCIEKPDELTPYVSKLQGMKHYTDTLARYQTYLRTEGMTNKASDVKQVMENFKKELEAIELDEKRLVALNNTVIRGLDNAIRKLVEPDFPTFVPNAQKAIDHLEEEVTKVYNNLDKMWQDAGKAEPFPLKWG